MTDWIARELDEAWLRYIEKQKEKPPPSASTEPVGVSSGRSVRMATYEVLVKYPYVIVAGEGSIEAGQALCYGPWATWDSKIKRFVVPVYGVVE